MARREHFAKCQAIAKIVGRAADLVKPGHFGWVLVSEAIACFARGASRPLGSSTM
jgi:hypothetical protein